MIDLSYTYHAMLRCIERGISEAAVHHTVANGELIQSFPDINIFGSDRIRVAVSQNGIVVTVYRVPKDNPKRKLRKIRKIKKQNLRSYSDGRRYRD
jgi:hypothetical protein